MPFKLYFWKMLTSMHMRIIILIVLFTSFISFTHAQSGWVREPGKYYIKASYSTFSSGNYYDTLGLLQPNVLEFSQQNVFLYGEYGFAKSFAFTLNWAPFRRNRYGNTDWVSGTGDPMLEVKYQLPVPLPVSLGLAAEIPLGNADLRVRDALDPAVEYILPTGDGEWNYLATLALSHSLHPEPAYIQGFVQYNYRTQYQGLDFQNQIRYGLEIGYRFGESLWINGALRGQSLAGKREGPIGDFTRGDGTTFNQLHLGASWNVLGNLSLTFDYENYASWFEERRNMYSGPVFIFGLALQSASD